MLIWNKDITKINLDEEPDWRLKPNGLECSSN